MDVIAQVQVASPFSFEFAEPGGFADPILALEGIRAGYGDKTVLAKVDMEVRPGARLGLLGRNGAGKSTLVRVLAGTLAPLAGERRLGKDVRVGYFAQHQLEQLRHDESPLAHMTRLDRQAREQDLRDYLGGFNFRGDFVTAPVGPMSGGEKARLALALIVYTKPHLLLLDEPTNHLDMDMRNALTMALQSFTGAMILVSHDRALLRATVDELWLVADAAVRPFDGDLDDYRAWLEKSVAAASETAAGGADAATRRDQRRAEAQNRQRLAEIRKPIEKRLKAVEAVMQQSEGRLRELETRLAAPDIYDPAQKDQLKTLLREQAECRARLEEAELEWLTLQEQLEAALAEAATESPA
jgi:ATP-binding cassette subfamily F protein 3